MSRCKQPMDLNGVDQALGHLINAQIKLGKEALKLMEVGLGSALDSVKNMQLPKGASCCDIPEPCWMPHNLGEICCHLSAGDVGEICFVITNEDFRPHDYTVVASGEDAGLVQVDKPQFTLGPKERRVVSARFKVPEKQRPEAESCCQCNDYEAVIWVQGCHSHYLNWNINTCEKSKKCCHEVSVDDKPDYVHHWYDHFYVMRPCPGPIITDHK